MKIRQFSKRLTAFFLAFFLAFPSIPVNAEAIISSSVTPGQDADGALSSFEIRIEDGKAKFMPPKGSTAYYQVGTADELVSRLGCSYFDSTPYQKPFAIKQGDVIYAKAERTDYEDSPVMMLDPFANEVRENVEVAGVSLNQNELTLKPGLTASLTASLTPADAGASFRWEVLSKTPSDLRITVQPSSS